MDYRREYADIALFAVERAQRSAAAKGTSIAAEAFVNDMESVQISVSNRAVEQLNAVKEAGIGLRLLCDGKMAFGSTNDLSRSAVASLVEDLVRKVVYHSADEFNVIPGPEDGAIASDDSGYADLNNYDPTVSSMPINDKIARALKMEASGLGLSPKIVGSMFAVYQDLSVYTYLANSRGISGWFRQSNCTGTVEYSAAEGAARESGSYTKSVVKWADFDPEAVGTKAARNALDMLGARPIRSAEIPLVVSPEIGTELWSFIAEMLSADAVQKGRSLFAGKIGTRVAAAGLTLIDDGRLKGGVATAPVDGEGVATQTTTLISEGMLRSYLYDCYTARKAKTRSTGNRSRNGYSSEGGIGPTNLYLKPGSLTPEAIFQRVKRGFYLTVALGLFAAIDTASGDFSIPAAGFMIENGRKSFPVRGVTVGGNLFELLKHVEMIGNDLTWFQSVGSPTFSVSRIKIGGA